MIKFEVLIIIFLFPFNLFSQESKVYGGLELGLIKNWNTKSVDEVGVFIKSQDYVYTVNELFQKAYLAYESKYGLRVDFFRATYSNLICAKGNISIKPNGRECRGNDWNAYQINGNINRKLYPFGKRLFFSPSLGIGVMWYGSNSYSLGSGGGSRRGNLYNYYYDHMGTYFRNTNIVLNSGIGIGYKVNPRLNFILHYNYQQGIFKMYQNDIIAWTPDDYDVYEPPTDPSKLMDVKFVSRGSNSHFGIGAEIYLLSVHPKNKK